MLDGSGVSDHIGIEHIGVGGFLHVLLALLEDALDALAGLTGGLGVAESKHFFEALPHLSFRLLKMVLEGPRQLGPVGLLRHLRQHSECP
jgi:hypothetical protein